MTKLQIKDLNPEVLDDVAKLESADAIKEYFANKDIEVSDKVANMIHEHASEGGIELNEETLQSVSGGVCNKKSGTAIS